MSRLIRFYQVFARFSAREFQKKLGKSSCRKLKSKVRGEGKPKIPSRSSGRICFLQSKECWWSSLPKKAAVLVLQKEAAMLVGFLAKKKPQFWSRCFCQKCRSFGRVPCTKNRSFVVRARLLSKKSRQLCIFLEFNFFQKKAKNKKRIWYFEF